jgi:hypothetical protein
MFCLLMIVGTATGFFSKQVLAATLTLFKPEGGADYAHHILMSPPSFESPEVILAKMLKGIQDKTSVA